MNTLRVGAQSLGRQAQQARAKAFQTAKKNPIITVSGIVMFVISIATLILVIFIHGKQSKKCASSNKENMTSTPCEQLIDSQVLPALQLPVEVTTNANARNNGKQTLQLRNGHFPMAPKAYIDFFNNRDKQKFDVVFNWGQGTAPIVGIDETDNLSITIQYRDNEPNAQHVPIGRSIGSLSIKRKL